MNHLHKTNKKTINPSIFTANMQDKYLCVAYNKAFMLFFMFFCAKVQDFKL